MNTSDTLPARKPGLKREPWKPSPLPPALAVAGRSRVEGAKGALRKLRETALADLERLGFPQRKAEAFSYVRLSDVNPVLERLPAEDSPTESGETDASQTSQSKHVTETTEGPVAVFVDGVFRPELSRLDNTSRPRSLSSVSELPEWILADQSAHPEEDAAAAQAKLLASEAWLWEFTDIMEAPLTVLLSGTGSDATRGDSALFFHVGPSSRAQVIFRHQSPDGAQAHANHFAHAHVEPNGELQLARLQDEGDAAWHLSKLSLVLSRDSRAKIFAAPGGSALTRLNLEAFLEGEGGDFQLDAASVLAGKRQVHHYVNVHHVAARCTSRQHFKNVVGGAARSSVDGTVVVAKGAQLTNAAQLVNNLMLSDTGRADNKPNLRIHADDVKCTHGATLGQMDPEQLFYLRARGFSSEEAKRLLTEGFANEIHGRCPFPFLIAELKERLVGRLRDTTS